MKIQTKIAISVVVLLAVVGIIFLVEYNRSESTGFIIRENSTKVDSQLESSEVNTPDNIFLNLADEQPKENQSTEKKLIIGGGYEFFRDGGSYKKCISWGKGYCEETKLVCPSGYDRILSGKYKEDPTSNSNLEQWFLCVDNSTIKINVTSKSNENFPSSSSKSESSIESFGGLVTSKSSSSESKPSIF